MTFVQNFWNRWNTNHVAFVREMRQNIVDMFVNDDTKVKKCPSGVDKICRDRDRNSYWSAGNLSRNRSACSVRSVSKKRSSRSVSRGAIDPSCGGCVGGILTTSRPSKRYYVECGDSAAISYCGDENQWNCTNYSEFVIIILLSVICMAGAFGGTVYWVMTMHKGIGFPWDSTAKGDKLLYFHPMAMVGGFILSSGFSILVFRICRCCKRLCAKMIHLFFHLLGGGAIGLGSWAIFNHHKAENLHLYSIHSWVGVLALGLFALQFVFGTFFFLILLFCEDPTACCRAAIVPIHAGLGLASYTLAICACIIGISERVTTIIGAAHKKNIWQASQEQQILYGIAAALALLSVLMIYICRKEDFHCRYQSKPKRSNCN